MAWRVTSEGIVQSTEIVPVQEIMFGDYLERVFEQNSDRVAIVDTETDRKYTFGDVLRIGKSIAASLQKRGVKPHDLVVLCAMTGLKSCLYIVALVFCQATMVATKHFFSVYELKSVLKNFPSLKLVIGDNASTSKLREATKFEVMNLEEHWDLSLASEFKRPEKADPKTSVMLMCLTSGSTGPSKAVCITHYSSMGNLAQWSTIFANYLMCNPISHLSGNLCFLMSLAKAEKTFMASETIRDDMDKYLEMCEKCKVESGLAMPVLLTNLANYGPTDKLATVKRLFTGGSAIPQPVIEEFRALHPHIKIEVIFGSSEAGVILQSVDQNKINNLAVLPNVEVKIVDVETNEILGPNKNGMLWCKAPSIAIGYYNNEKATKEAFVDGWQVTGDLAYRDEEGYIVIVDRLKQMIKCLDSQVAPADLELILSQDDDVLNVLVAGVPHEKYGEAAAAFVIPRSTENLRELRKRLMGSIESKCAFFKHLHGGLYFVKEMPETDSGKFSRKDVVQKHLKKELQYLD